MYQISDSALSLGLLKMVNLRLSGLYLFTEAEVLSHHAVYRRWVRRYGWRQGRDGSDGGMRVAARVYKGRTSLLRTVGNLQVAPVFMQDARPYSGR